MLRNRWMDSFSLCLVSVAAMGALVACEGPSGNGSQRATGAEGTDPRGTPPPTPGPTPTPTQGTVPDAQADGGTLDCTAADACADVRCAREPACQRAESNAPCDVFAQDCADPGERCYPYSTTAAHNGACFRDGTRTLGQSCEEPPYGEAQACRKGLLCVATSEDPGVLGACLTVCRGSRDCAADEQCFGLDTGGEAPFTFGVCAPRPFVPPTPCDPITNATCAGGEMCGISEAQGNLCIPAGAGALNSACSGEGDCAPGLHCAALSGWLPDGFTLTLNEGYLSRGDGLCMAPCHGHIVCAAGATCSQVGSLNPPEYVRSDLMLCYPATPARSGR